jgi:hypothetical protein
LEGGLQAFFDKSFAQALDRAGMDLESVPDLFVGPAVSLRSLIRLQENARMPLLESSRFPLGDESVHIGALLRGESDEVSLLGQRRTPFPIKGIGKKDTAATFIPQF